MSKSIVMKSVAYMLKENLKQVRHIVSFSSEVDRLMGGGFPLGRITEIAGEAGLGKTQFCFQLCVDVQIPTCLGGVEGEAVFLDVEGTFFPQRVAQITTATVQHCHHIADLSESSQCVEAMKDFTTESVMSRIYLFSCRNCVQLLAATHQMKEFLKSHPKVKILIVDSVAQCVRGEEDMRSRSKFLTTLGRIFQDLVAEFDIAIVLTNQVTTRINDKGPSYNIPALGMRWSHLASVKLMLHRQNLSRYIHQYKSPEMRDGMAQYRVAAEGIRDIEDLIQSQSEDSVKNCAHWKDYYNSQATNTSTQENSSVQFYPITQGIATEMMTEWELPDENTHQQNMNCQQLDNDSKSRSQTQSTSFPKEEIPDKWLELSQRQLCDVVDISKNDYVRNCDNFQLRTKEEPNFVLGEENVIADDEKNGILLDVGSDFKLPESSKENQFSLQNDFPKESERQIKLDINSQGKPTVKSSQKLRRKAEVILQQTVETMLSSEVPVKAPPSKKRVHAENETLPLVDENCKKLCSAHRKKLVENAERLEPSSSPQLMGNDRSTSPHLNISTPPSPVLRNKTRRSKKS